jgi:hypothetical protein
MVPSISHRRFSPRNVICQQPHLWSNGQSSWVQIHRSRVRFSALPDFLISSVSGTGSPQPREDNWGAIWMENYWLRSRKLKLTSVVIRYADHATSSIRKKLTVTSPTSGGRSVGIVLFRTKPRTLFLFVCVLVRHIVIFMVFASFALPDVLVVTLNVARFGHHLETLGVEINIRQHCYILPSELGLATSSANIRINDNEMGHGM